LGIYITILFIVTGEYTNIIKRKKEKEEIKLRYKLGNKLKELNYLHTSTINNYY